MAPEATGTDAAIQRDDERPGPLIEDPGVRFSKAIECDAGMAEWQTQRT